MLETYVIAILFPIGFALAVLGILREIDLHVAEWRAVREFRDDPYGLGPAAPGSIERTFDEIRALPEIPFDWQREEAV